MLTNEKEVKLPRKGTAARMFIMNWQYQRDISWSDAEFMYDHALRVYGRRPQRQHICMNLSRLLRRYGTKLGAPGSRAKWSFGKGQTSVSNVVPWDEAVIFSERYFSAACV